MNLPPLLLAVAVMFWGWQCGQWWLAATVAVLFEAPRAIPFRFALSLSEMNRLANFCTLAFVAVAAYMVFSSGAAQAVIGTLQWAPLVVLPLFLAMAWCGMQRLDLSVISASLRRRAKADPTAVVQADLGYPYLMLWVLAASVANRPGPEFYLGLLAISSWVMWRFRPVGRTPLPWAAALLVAAIGGALINSGLYRLQDAIEQSAMDWITGEGEEDPARTSTSLGHIGELKLSDSIALRVSASASLKLPLLLRTASYDTFSSSSWLLAGNNGFQELPQVSGQAKWWLGKMRDADRSMAPRVLEISAATSRDSSLIALPDGAISVASAMLTGAARNRLGSVLVSVTPGSYHYQVNVDGENPDRAATGPADLMLPAGDGKLLLELAHRLQLDGKSDQEKLRLVRAYFSENFSYSTFRTGNAANRSAISDFLLRNRSGHCEHFASATALLLRAAGIPTRYAVGFSVAEPARFGGGYVARHRHAHAWTRAYVDGAWQDFDTTPASWIATEQRDAPSWEVLLDVWSWLLFHARQGNFFDSGMLAFGAGALGLIWLVRNLTRRKGNFISDLLGKGRRTAKKPGAVAETESELFKIDRLLAGRGLSRPSHEPLSAWMIRIAPAIGEDAAAHLAEVLRLHYRWRFGPEQVRAASRGQLRDAASEWIARHGL